MSDDQSMQSQEAMDAQQIDHSGGDGTSNGEGGPSDNDDDRYR